MVQGIVGPFGEQEIEVPAGSKIAIASYGCDQTGVEIGVQGPNPTVIFGPLATLINEEQVFGTYSLPQVVRITAGADTVYYTVGADPVAQQYTPQITAKNVYTFLEDFNYYDASDWTVTVVGTGTASLAAGNGGVLDLTNSAADNDAVFLQKPGLTVRLDDGKPLWFDCRFKVNDATQSDFVFGLQVTDTTPLDVGWGVFFLKSDGANTADFYVEKSAVATITPAVATIEDDTFTRLGFYYNGVDNIDIFQDGQLVGQSSVANLPDDVSIGISFGIQNGEAVAKTMDIDYFEIQRQR